MRKLFATLSLSFLVISSLYGQPQPAYELYGSHIDMNGQLIHEHADQEYAPYKTLHISFNAGEHYSPGTYYKADGSSESGKILYEPGRPFFLFKKDPYAKKERTYPSRGWAIKVGADSLIMAKGFAHYNKLGLVTESVAEYQFLEYLGKTSQFSFFKYTQPITGTNYLLRLPGQEEFISLPRTHKSFMKVAKDLFKDYPDMIGLLEQKELDYNNVIQLIRFIRYTDALEGNKSLSYTASWDICEKPEEQAYDTKVSRSDEKHWKIDFYNVAGKLLFTEHRSYTQPGFMDGEILWYYPDSEIIRKKTNFEMGRPNKRYDIFHPNGQLHYTVTHTDFGNTIYYAVNSEGGKPLLNAKGSGSEVFYDLNSGHTIHREYKKYLLVSSWYLDKQNRKIYQFAKRNVRLKSLKTINFNLSRPDEYPESDLKTGSQGILLLKLIISPEGRVMSYKIPQSFSKTSKYKAQKLMLAMRFRPAKQGREKVYQEVIIPVRFSILHKKPRLYRPYDHSFMQQHMMQQPSHITPPSFPKLQ